MTWPGAQAMGRVLREPLVGVEGFYGEGALPVLGSPQTDGSGTAADGQLSRQVRATGHTRDECRATPFSHTHLHGDQPR